MRTAFSVGTLDNGVWRASEPGTPHPKSRLEAVAKLNDAGISCGVLIAPILPGISDDPQGLEATVRGALEAGAAFVSPILLHLRPVIREEFMPWLRSYRPDLAPAYEGIYRRSAYAPTAMRERLANQVSEIIDRLGGTRKGQRPHRTRHPAPARRSPEGWQLRLKL